MKMRSVAAEPKDVRLALLHLLLTDPSAGNESVLEVLHLILAIRDQEESEALTSKSVDDAQSDTVPSVLPLVMSRKAIEVLKVN